MFFQVIEAFRANKIKGRVLAMLNDSDLTNLGIRAMGDRKYLLHIFANAETTGYEKVKYIIIKFNLVSIPSNTEQQLEWSQL